MLFDWPKFVAKMVLYALLLAIVFMLCVWAVVLIQSNNSMQNLLDDLVLIVSEENCLDETGGSNSSASLFAQALEDSETSWLKFNTSYDTSSTLVDDAPTAILVCQPGTEKSTRPYQYNSYATAPQRGAHIHCAIRGTVTLPVIIAPFGQQRLKVVVPFEKHYNTMALKFFKDKAA